MSNNEGVQRRGSFVPIPMREMRIQVKHQQVGDSIEGWRQESRPRILEMRNNSLESNSTIVNLPT